MTLADTTPATIADHPFTTFKPILAWDRCTICGLAVAAHLEALVIYEPPADLPYRCPDCVQTGTATCSHREGA